MAEDKFTKLDDNNGLRLSWHIWPTNRLDAMTCGVPIGVLYTPLKQIAGREPLPYEPVYCRGCHGVLNSYCQIDYTSHVWTCPLCQARNPLPQSYHQMTPECLPVELHPDVTTVEYTLPGQSPPPVFLFVVDTCHSEKEHEFLKSQLMVAINCLPAEALIGFMSFGSLVRIHELTTSDFPRSYLFSGNKTYSVAELRQLLSLADGYAPFFMPGEDAELVLTSFIDKLQVDSCPVPKGERFQRCTGAALHIATTLIESIFPQSGGQIILFTSGPITKGPGVMATLKRTEPVRQHSDIEKNKAPMTSTAYQFFSDLGTRASEHGIVINYMSASFEETGLYEVEPCILKTGGWLTSGESWDEENISQTLQKYFSTIYPVFGSNCSISMKGTKNFKIAGCIGPCTSVEDKSGRADQIAEKAIGNGNCTEWKVCGILPSTTLAFFIDIHHSKADPVPTGSTAFMQFITRYKHVQSGTTRLRVTTHGVRMNDLANSFHLISQSFDQEAASVLIARYAMWKVRDDDLIDSIHWIDRTLIKFCKKFGTYNKNDPQSFSLSASFGVFPQFMYHLRRSPFMSTFNATPDLTTSLRHSLLLEDVTNSLFMIQPTLTQYTLDGSVNPVVLDMNSLQRNCVLLLDTYFRVLVWVGGDIAAWRNAGYHNQPEYANLKTMLEEPVEEAKEYIETRFPTPTLVVCDQDSGLSRYLLTRCNPSSQSFGGEGELESTDEATFSKFYMKLKNVVVRDG